MKSILEKHKKAQLGLGAAKIFVLAILVLVIIGVVALIVLNKLKDVSTAGQATDDLITGVADNISKGTASFFSNSGTWFTLLSVVVIIMIIAVVIVVVNRFGGTGGRSDFT